MVIMQTERKETHFWKFSMRKTLNMGTPTLSKEFQASLTQKLWNNLPSRNREGLGRKTSVMITMD